MWARFGGGAITDGSKNFYRIKQTGDVAQYVVTAATNTAALPMPASGVTSGGAYQAVSLANYVPSTAILANLALYSGGGSTATNSAVAPNGSYGVAEIAPQPPLQFSGDTAGAAASYVSPILLESMNVYYACSSAGGVTAPALNILGWRDQI
jgi:hypothetical protein